MHSRFIRPKFEYKATSALQLGGALASDRYGISPRVQSFPPLPASLRLKATKGHFHTLLEETVEIQQENKSIKATKIYKQKIQMTASALEYWESSRKCIYIQLLERNAFCGTTPSHRHHAKKYVDKY